MEQRLFLFLQMEFPWELGPADGRYLMRLQAAGEPERIVVLNTTGAAKRGRRPRSARRRAQATAEPELVPTSRATVIDPVAVEDEAQAHAWLGELDAAGATQAAASTLNRMLYAHRIATADPHMRELSPAQALVIRAGWGEGEQVADGHWLHAVELPWSEPRARRSAALRPQERLAVLLGARDRPLVCEELTLRARLDLDEGRLTLAALELERAYAAALAELPADERPELAERIAELEQLHAGVVEAAHIALPGGDAEELPEAQLVSHALGRLEAALRARTALGFNLQ